jgi:ferric-dicitrate binding protein FerR (iron transport regulator)
LVLAGLTACSEEAPPPLPQPSSKPPPAVEKPPPEVAQKPAGALENLQGKVTLERDGKTAAAQVGPVFTKDAIETGEGGQAVLRLPGEHLVELGPEGRFVVEESGGGVVLTVAKGLVLTRVPASRADGGEVEVLLTISTPFGLTRVGGASVQITVGETSADVDVKLGEIEVVPKGGEATKLGAGKKTSLGGVRELKPITLSIVAAAGKAEHKPAGAKAFTRVNPKVPPRLAAGDALKVTEGQVTVAPDGSSSRFTLKRASEVVLLEAGSGAGFETTALDLKRGELEVSNPRAQTTKVGVAAGVLLTSEGGQYAVRKVGGGFELDAKAGDVTVERDGQKPVVVPGGRTAVIGAKDVEVKEASREVVVLPSRNGLKLFHSGIKKVSLAWDGPDEVKDWRVVVSSEPTFTSPSLDGVVHERFVTVPVPARGVLYWRVYRGEEEHERGNLQVSPEPSSMDLSRNKNLVPDGPDTTTIYYQDKPPVVTFTWGQEDGAARYALKVYREGELGKVVAERTTDETQVALPESTLAEGKYLWSVTPLDAKGQELKGGRLNKLHMVYDNAVPQLIIKSPRNGEAGGKTVKVAGIAPVGAKVFVNGKAMELDEKARFEAQVAPLVGGRVVFRMVHGNVETYTVRTVKGR